jgi:hypothetical protein
MMRMQIHIELECIEASLAHLNPLPNLPDEGCNGRVFFFFFVVAMNPRSPVFDNEGNVSGGCVVVDEEAP